MLGSCNQRRHARVLIRKDIRRKGHNINLVNPFSKRYFKRIRNQIYVYLVGVPEISKTQAQKCSRNITSQRGVKHEYLFKNYFRFRQTAYVESFTSENTNCFIRGPISTKLGISIQPYIFVSCERICRWLITILNITSNTMAIVE